MNQDFNHKVVKNRDLIKSTEYHQSNSVVQIAYSSFLDSLNLLVFRFVIKNSSVLNAKQCVKYCILPRVNFSAKCLYLGI